MKKRDCDNWFVVGLVISLTLIVVYILMNTKYNAQSDWATAVLLAREQIRSGQWFPDGWIYAQSIWAFSLNLLVIPFLLITDNMLLAREMAVIIQTLVCVYVCYSAMKKMMKKTSALFVCILLLIPLSTVVNRNFYYEATYYLRVFWLALLIIIGDKVCKYMNEKNKAKVSCWIVTWTFVCGAMLVSSAKALVMTVVPCLGAIVLFGFIDSNVNVSKILKGHTAILLCVFMILGTVLGLLFNQQIKSSVIFDNGVAEMVFSNSGQWGGNIADVFTSFVELYGLECDGNVVSIGGTVSILKAMLAILLVVVIPLWALFSYKKMKNIYQQIFVWYSVFAAFLMLYICAISDGMAESARYFLGIYINNMILAGICFDCVVVQNKDFRRMTVVGVLGVSLVCAVQYKDYEEIEYEGYMELIDLLKEQGISYGYTEYWNAGVTTVLSNGDVELLAHEDRRQGTPLYWLCSTEWYEAEYHEGDFCIVVEEGSFVDEIYREAADEVYQVAMFEVLVFRKDTEMYPHLFVAFPQKTGDSFEITGNNIYWKSMCGTVEGAARSSQDSGVLVYGPYCVLASGVYRIEVDMKVIGKGANVELACGSQIFGNMWCGEGESFVLENIHVPDRTIGSEIRISVAEDTTVRMESVTITKVEP